MQIGTKEFDVWKHTYVMGILNVTPDSFSDGGRYNTIEKALFRAEEMIEEGADILDIGGESTRPGYLPVSWEEEVERIVPVIEKIKQEFNIPISIDTSKAKVAQEAIKGGADCINDIWGFQADEDMAEVAAKSKVVCCLMHNRQKQGYIDLLEDMKKDLEVSLKLAEKAGVERDKIILDPGVGFAKSQEENIRVIHSIEYFQSLGYPLLLGTSRKSVIGNALNLPVGQRLEGTLVTTVYAVLHGCSFVRVHDIKENVRAIKMAEAIRDGWIKNG